MDPELLKIVRCPVTKSTLSFAEESLIEQLNLQIKGGELFNRAGQAVENSISAGLVNEDGTLLLPIRNGIAIMVADQAIVIQQGSAA
ncbi:MAG: hypothetical protein AAFN77_07225 [Planctomycetota bacterium]